MTHHARRPPTPTGLPLGVSDDVAVQTDKAQRWLNAQTHTRHRKTVLGSLGHYTASNGHPTRTPAAVTPDAITAAHSAVASLGLGASPAFLYLLEDGSLVVLPSAGLVPGFDPRLVSLCDPGLLEACAAVQCTGSPSAANDAMEAGPSPLFHTLRRLCNKRAAVVRVLFLVCGPGVRVEELLGAVTTATVPHPSLQGGGSVTGTGGGVSIAAAPLAVLRRALLEQHSTLVAQSTGWRAAMRSGGDPWADRAAASITSTSFLPAPLHLLAFYRPGDGQDTWAPVLSPSASAVHCPSSFPPTARWVPGIVTRVSVERASTYVTVALSHAEDSVVVPLQRVRAADGALANRSVAPDDAVLVCVDAPWLGTVSEYMKGAMRGCSFAPESPALVALPPLPCETPRPPGTSDIDVLCVSAEERSTVTSSEAPSIKVVCAAVGKAAVSVPAVRVTASLPTQVSVPTIPPLG